MITGPQCRAARALVQLSREELARASGVPAQAISDFENRITEPAREAVTSLRHALEEGGAVFIPDGDGGGGGGGLGVRLKFTQLGARQIGRWEGEGGTTGEDDVP